MQTDPPGANNKIGEHLLDSPEKANVFVELKSRRWRANSQEDIAAGRQHQPKNRKQVEGGAVGNWDPVQRCIESDRTYPKFTDNQPNLLIIADDLKVPLHFSLIHVQAALFGSCTAVSGGRVLQLQLASRTSAASASSAHPHRVQVWSTSSSSTRTRTPSRRLRLPQSLLDKFDETCTYSVKGTDPRKPAPVL